LPAKRWSPTTSTIRKAGQSEFGRCLLRAAAAIDAAAAATDADPEERSATFAIVAPHLQRRHGPGPSSGIRPAGAQSRGSLRAGGHDLRSSSLTTNAQQLTGRIDSPIHSSGTLPAATATMTEAMDQSNSYLHLDAAELTAAEILRRVHDLVAFGWCQGADATDEAGSPVDPWSLHACHWSLLGALAAALGAPNLHTPETPARIAELRLALIAISDLIPDWSLEHWNDHPARTQAGVVATLASAQRRVSISTHQQP
jgi:hypothetical protein